MQNTEQAIVSMAASFAAVQSYFAFRVGDKTFKRRPSLALRFVGDGFVAVVKPNWNSKTKTINSSWLAFEYQTETDGTMTVRDCGGYISADDVRLTHFRLFCSSDDYLSMPEHKQPEIRKQSIELAIEKTAKVRALFSQFAVDPYAVAKQSENECLCCGRPLTDEVSRARGIGPECASVFDKWVRLRPGE